MKRSLHVLLAILVVALILAGCAQKANPAQEAEEKPAPNETAQQQQPENRKEVDNPMVTIRTESGGEIKIELYPDVAPNTVKNFVSLVRKGFYDGTTFHRVIPGFMVQGGDPNGNGTGGPGYAIRGEFAQNGFPNDLKHSRGVISMARTGDPNSAGSQFFIMVADAPHLDGAYAAFGKVVSGMDEVDRIVGVRRGANDRPVEEQRMVEVTVEYDEEDVEPEKV